MASRCIIWSGNFIRTNAVPSGYFGQMQESTATKGMLPWRLRWPQTFAARGETKAMTFYALKDDRIVCGFEYVNAYNSGVDDLPNSPYTNCDGLS